MSHKQADERGGGGEKTERKGEQEKRKLVKTNAGSWPKKNRLGSHTHQIRLTEDFYLLLPNQKEG